MKIKVQTFKRFVVLDATGKPVMSFKTRTAAKTWIAGYLAAAKRLEKLANR